jgi:Ca2+/H+ antiporter
MNESYVRTRKKVNTCYINIKKYVMCHEEIVTVSAYFIFYFFRQKSHTKLFDVSAALHSACAQPEQRPHLNHLSQVSRKTYKLHLSR